MPSTPKYKDLGKKYKDLLNDDFDYDNVLKVKRKTANGVKLDSALKITKTSTAGDFKAVIKDAELGELELKGSTSNKFSLKWKLMELAEGLKTTFKADLSEKKGVMNSKINTTFDYTQENVCGTLALTSKDMKGCEASASVVAGMEGVFMGATMESPIKSEMSMADVDWHVAMEVQEGDFTFGLNSEPAPKGSDSKTPVFKASFFQTVREGYENAVMFQPFDKVITLASSYDLDDATTVKAKACSETKLDSGAAATLETAVTHTLANPSMKINFATMFKQDGFSLQTEKFGVGITMGSI